MILNLYMENSKQKGIVALPIIAIVITLVLAVAGYVYYRSIPHELSSNPDFAQDVKETTQLDVDSGLEEGSVVDISYPEDGAKITYSGEWKGAEINDDPNYRHSVNIWYPATWQFSCCGDMDSGSGHFLDPNPSDPKSDVKPSITIFDFALYGCPETINNCSIDERQKVTSTNFISSMLNSIEKSGTGLLGITDLKKTTPIKLSNFIGDVPVYTGLSQTIQPVELYLLQSSKGVVGVVFQQPQVFDATFKMDFLNRLTPN